jgi:8-oxo-dGTP pyrophosphatase MutT (NUDIX family)
MVDDGDESILATALRESEEEIGLERSQIDVLGQFLTVPSMRGLRVTCFVGDLGNLRADQLQVNKDEVDHLFTMDLEELYIAQRNASTNDLEANFRKTDRPIMSWKVPPHKVGGRDNVKIWGLTGYLLSEFISQIAYPSATAAAL